MDLRQPAADAWGEARGLARLASPVVFANLGFSLMGLVDALMVGHVSADALASISLGNTWSLASLIFGYGVCAGLDPLIAQARGARDKNRFGIAIASGTLLLGGVSIPIVVLHLLAGPALRGLGQPADLIPLARDYCQLLAWSVPGGIAFAYGRGILQAGGRVMPAAWVVSVANLVNIPANLWFIHGYGSWEGLGPVGVGWSTLLLRTAMGIAMVAWVWPAFRRARRHVHEACAPPAFRHTAVTALPVGVQQSFEAWAFNASTFMVGIFGEVALAAHTVALTAATMSFMVPMGVAAAASARVGNLAGARQPWGQAAMVAVGLGASVMVVSGALYATFPVAIASYFTPNEADVVALAATLLPMAALFQVFDGTQVVAFGVLRGAGDTRLPALANIVGYWIWGLPGGWILAKYAGWGPHGIWMGLTLGLAIVATLLVLRVSAVHSAYAAEPHDGVHSRVGLVDGALRPVPKSPNAVSTQAAPDDARHWIAPVPFDGDVDRANARILSWFAAERGTNIIRNDGHYVHATFTTRLLGFVDDVEFLLTESEGLIHFRSASRVGYSDVGTNRRRMERFRRFWMQSSGAEPTD